MVDYLNFCNLKEYLWARRRCKPCANTSSSCRLWQDLDLMFPSKVGTPIDQRNLLKDFCAVLTRAGLMDELVTPIPVSLLNVKESRGVKVGRNF